MHNEVVPITAASASVFTYLQADPTLLTNPETTKHLVISTLLGVVTNLVVKVGNELIKNIKAKRAKKRALKVSADISTQKK
jgi:hypothetical protein